METVKRIYVVIVEDHHGHDEVETIQEIREEAELVFNSYKGGVRYCRWEVCDVIGGSDEEGWQLDNNDTIESYYGLHPQNNQNCRPV